MFTLNIKHKIRTFNQPLIMGILNITPDSFFDGGKFANAESALARAKQMQSEGADIIDVGAYSSRPGAKAISEAEEWQRLEPILELLHTEMPEMPISIDTFRASIARKSVEKYGVALINDISAGDDDPEMFPTVADLQVPYIAMHKQGNPETMQKNPKYSDVVKEILLYFSKKIEQAHLCGTTDFIIDPGFGFGKTLEHNFSILKNLSDFKMLDKPILVGLSRKSMIHKTLKISPEEALNGTTALNMVALQNGADILRVHDVKEAVELRTLYNSLKNE